MYKDIVLGFEFEVEGINSAIYDLIDNSAHITAHTDHYIEEYHDTRYKTAEGKWRVEEDQTISGAEFITPLLKYNDARTICKAFFEEIENTSGIKTTSACGLHVGMSVNGTLHGIDLTNLIPNINYRLLATLWPDRMLGNHCYCNNLGRMIKKVNPFGLNNNILNCNIKPNVSSISKTWMDNAYSFIKTKHYENIEYIEFRVPGGVDYHLKFDELFISIDHISDILLGRTRLSKKKSTKKMYSYLNRVYKNLNYTHFVPPLIPEIFLENRLSQPSFRTVYNATISKLEYINNQYIEDKKKTRIDSQYIIANKEKIREDLNADDYIYCLLEYMVAKRMRSDLEIISSIINNTLVISIPKNKQQSDIIKMLKLWPVLPRNLVLNLLIKLNQKTYNYFIKYYINNTNNPKQRNWVLNICKHGLNN